MSAPYPSLVNLDSLTELFFANQSDLGLFQVVKAADLPEIPRSLLAHESHMTETVEQFHRSLVDVAVLRSRKEGAHYSREILLTTVDSGFVVQYGIVRLNLAMLEDAVVAEIESENKPLGRILKEHDVLRTVRLENLFSIQPGKHLSDLLQIEEGQNCYGRTAMIFCDSVPTIELLEIVPGVQD